MKKSTLALALDTSALNAAAGKQAPAPANTAEVKIALKAKPKLLLVGAHYPPEVRRTLILLRAVPENEGKNLKALLGEAINDLCAKYGKPQPYTSGM